MKVKYLLDEIEQEAAHRITGHIATDRFELLTLLSQEHVTLCGQFNWDFAQKWMDPVIKTKTGVYDYPLPDDFPLNFVFGGDKSGDKFLCKINNDTNESYLDYETPAQFFNHDYESATNSSPTNYTILSSPSGGKKLRLFPPPNSNSDTHYEILGVYTPDDWQLADEDDIPAVMTSSPFLRHRVLARYLRGRNNEAAAFFMQQADRDLVLLQFRHARSRRMRVTPRLGRFSRNEYSLMRR